MSENEALAGRIVPENELSPAQKIAVRVVAIARVHGYKDSSVVDFFAWLEDRLTLADAVRLRRADEAKLESLDIYGASRQDTRPPGKFAQGLRRAQEQSTSQAMVLMADDLQRAYERIGQLEAELREMDAQLEEWKSHR